MGRAHGRSCNEGQGALSHTTRLPQNKNQPNKLTHTESPPKIFCFSVWQSCTHEGGQQQGCL